MAPRIIRVLSASWSFRAAITLGLGTFLVVTIPKFRIRNVPDDLHIVMPAPNIVPHASTENITQWIKALGSDHDAVQENARRQLRAVGDAALPVLQRCLEELTTPQLRREFRAVTRTIAQADVLRGPFVTPQLNQATLRQVINRLCQPAGMQPEFFPLFASGSAIPAYFDHERISVNVQRQPFWAVLQRLAQVTGVSTERCFFDQVLHLGADQFGIFQKSNPVDLDGAFLFVLQWPSERWGGQRNSPTIQPKPLLPTSIVTYAGPRILEPAIARNLRRMHVQVNFLWCPDGNRLSHLGDLKSLQVFDSSGISMTLSTNTNGEELSAWDQFRQLEFTYYLRLNRPPTGLKAIATIRGSVPSVISFNLLTRQIDNLGSGKALMDIHENYFKFGKPKIDATGEATRSGLTRKLELTIIANMVGPRKAKPLAGFIHGLHDNGDQSMMLKSANGTHWKIPVLSSSDGLGADYHYVFGVDGPEPVFARVPIYRQRPVKMDVPFIFQNVPLPR